MTPEKIGKYTVVELLGRGGMGEVYLGEDPYIGRRVAIKMIKGADPAARDRFLHEARVIGGLAHPAIVSLIDFDFSGDEPFLVMELLKGKGLDAWIREAHTLREKLVILEDVCQALACAHENGVLHRDVKPSNVQVLPNGHAKLMDFGIARGSAARLTATGAVMGTPEYMAPEILKDAAYSAQSDLYATAVLLYEMFTGENPFAGRTVAATLTNVLTRTPVELRSVRDEIPEALSAAVMRCLAKEPEARPAGFEDLLAAGREALSAPVPVVPETRAIPIGAAVAGSLGDTRATPAFAAGRSGLWRWPVVLGLAVVAGWLALRASAPPQEPGASSVPAPETPVQTAAVAASVEPSAADRTGEPLHRGRAAEAPEARRAMPVASPPAGRNPEAAQSGGTPLEIDIEPLPSPVATPAATIALEPRAPVAPTVVPAPPLPVRSSPSPEAPSAAVAPSLTSVAPRAIRRGSSVVLELRGTGLRTDLGARILQGRRPAVGIRVVRVEFVSPILLRVTVLSEAEVPLGGYTVVLQDASGVAIPGLQIEVVL